MKKQICFAGFASVELEALQPSLAALNGTWNCVFAPDATAALTAMDSIPFDATVANLTPDNISTPEMLQQAAIRHPRTLRFALGDVVDRELVVNCMGAAHQFISRPWKPRDLVSIIERSFALDNWLSNDKLRAFIPRLGKLPGLPSTYFEVIKRAESPSSSVESISEIISQDPTLTARLLQMVNSPACGIGKKVTSPSEAVSRLGLDTVKSLVLCLQLYAESAPAKVGGVSLDKLWRHSFNVAKLASKIVVNCISSEGMASEAYTAGLLHNIGQIVLASNLPEEYGKVIKAAKKRKCALQEVEMEEMDVTSNQIGAYLLGLWGMPLPIVEATALNHAPASAATIEFSLLTVVHVANVLASEAEGPIGGLPLPQLDGDYMATLDLPTKPDGWRKILSAPPVKSPEPAQRQAPSPRGMTPAAPKPENRLGKKIFAGMCLATLAIAGVAFKQGVVPMPHAVASVFSSDAKSNSAPQPADSTGATTTSAEPAKPTTPSEVLDSLKLQTILYSPAHVVAMINGKALETGDKISGAKIVSIDATKVVLAYQGDLRTLKLK